MEPVADPTRGQGTVPVDLVGAAILAWVLGILVWVGGIDDSWLIGLLSIPFVLFLPGYVLLAIAFPRAGRSPANVEVTGAEADEPTRGIDLLERGALGIGLSVLVLPFVGFAVVFLEGSLTHTAILAGLIGIVFIGVPVAILRRRRIPVGYRYSVTGPIGRRRVSHSSSIDFLVNLTLGASIVILVLAVGLALAVPQPGAGYTDLYIGTESDGETVTADYPTEIEIGESADVIVGIVNSEGESKSYTLIVQLEQFDSDGSEVIDREELDQREVTLSHGDTWEESIAIEPTIAGSDQRVSILLYTDRVSFLPEQDNADYHVHFWTNVTESES